MEKRRVRIYKAGGQQGSYINKTAKYFQGGIPMQEEEVVPEEQPMQELNDEQVIEFIMQTLSQPNGSIEQAKQQLVQANVHPARVTQLSDAALEYINQQQDIELANETGQQDEAAAMQAEQDAYAQAAADEEQALQEQAQLQEMYNQSAEGVEGISEDDPTSYMRKGGMLSKKAYINNYMKLAKKQEGGDTEKPKTDIKTDIPIGGREEKVGKFHNALKSTANNAALKKQAEDQYTQQMQMMQQMPQQGYAQEGGDIESGVSNFDPYHNLAHYSDSFEHSMPFNQLTQAQFGGWGQGRERRAARRMNRMMPQGFNQMGNMMGNQMINPFMQQQMNPLAQFMPNQGNLGLANIDVRRTGLFGRPKEYTINFNTVTPIKPQDIEDTKKQLINNADEIVKDAEADIKAEENNTSTEKNTKVLETAVAMPTVEDISVVDKTVRNNSGRNNSGRNIQGAPSNEPIASSSIPGMVTDQWGRPKSDKWYGFNPNTKKFDHGKSVAETVIDKANKYPNNAISSKVNYKIPNWQENVKNIFPSYGQPNQTSGYNQLTQRPSSFADEYYEETDPFGGGNPTIGWKPEKQQGGFVDPESGLYKFMSGGEDMSQMDLDYSNSKNISSPYFANGGYLPQAQNGIMHPDRAAEYIKENANERKNQTDNSPVEILDTKGNVLRKGTLAEAERSGLNHRMSSTTNTSTNNQSNISQGDGMGGPDYAQRYLQSIGMQYNPFSPGQAITRGGNWNKAIGNPYMTGTGNPISGMIGPNAQVSSINVDKTRMFGPNKGAPKKFTVNYNVPGQPGINATGTPQSYKGSDGQMHWMSGQDQTSQSNQDTGRRRPVADMLLRSKIPGLQQLGAKMIPWEGGDPSESMGNKYSKDDEAYKEHFGNYPGEDQESDSSQNTVDSLPTKRLDPIIDQERNIIPGDLRSSNLPNINPIGALATKSFKDLNTIDEFTNTENIIPGDNRSNPNYNMGQEPIPLEPGQAGNLTEEEVAFEQQRMQDEIGSGLNLLGVPTTQQNYMQQGADENTASRQDWELEQMRRQDPDYFNQAPYNVPIDLESLDYTQQVGPQVSQEQFNTPVAQQRRNIQSKVRQKTNTNNRNIANQSIDNKVNNTNWSNSNTDNMTRQQKADFQKREGKSYNELRALKENMQGANIKEFRESAQKIDNAGKKIFNRLTPTQKLDYLNKLKKIDRNLYEGYVSLLQEGGTALPKAQFGSTGEKPKTPLGYYDNPNRSGLMTNMAGDVYSPKTNFQGGADKLMENPFIQQGNGLTTDNSMGFNAEGTGYRNEGLLNDEEKEQQASQQVSQKFKNKQEWNIDPIQGLNAFNAGANKLLGFAERTQDALQNRNIGSKFDSSNIFATTSGRDKGGYDQLGQFKPNETGFKKPYRYGGYMEEGGSYEEGGDTWMSEEQIQQFLAEGGELEFV